MKLLALVLFVGVACAARLDNTYLPPSNARTVGAHQRFSNTPSSQYGVPNNHGVILAKQSQQSYEQVSYGAPSQSSPGYGASSRSNSADAHAHTLRFDNQNEGTGNYRFEFETENRISQQELGELKSVGDDEATAVQGSYSYAGDDGKTYTVNYVADENGFQPSGDHIPQAISNAASEAGRSSNGGYQYQKGRSGYNYNAPQQGYQRSQEYQQGSQGRQGYHQGQPGYQAQQGFQGQQGYNGQAFHGQRQASNGGYQY